MTERYQKYGVARLADCICYLRAAVTEARRIKLIRELPYKSNVYFSSKALFLHPPHEIIMLLHGIDFSNVVILMLKSAGLLSGIA